MKKIKPFFTTDNIYKLTLVKLSLTLVLLLIIQWLFWIFNSDFFNVVGFKAHLGVLWGSIVFAISAVCMLLLPYLILNFLPINLRYKKWYQGIANAFYVIGTLIGVMVNIIDIVFYRFTFRRMASDIFQYLGVGGDFKKLIPEFIHDYWPYFLIFIFIIILFTWVSNRFVLKPKPANAGTNYLKTGLLSILFFALMVLGVRGGFGYKPLRIIQAANYTSANNAALVVNTPFSILSTLSKKGISEEHYFASEEELNSIFSPINQGVQASINDSIIHIPPHANVVIFILESFSAEYMGCMNGGKESFTPFLDSLAKESIVFKGMANGKRSIEAVPSVLAGIPSLMNEAFISSNYSTDKIEGLGSVLKKEGYSSAFFHGAYNGSMGFDAFTKMAGFDKYYGMTEYGGAKSKDFDGTWGIFDEPFLQFMEKKLTEMPQPFVAGVFNISSHHPYKVPQEHIGQFKKGKLPILEVVMYSDYAIKKFFEKASKEPWFKNTLFVFTADHTAQVMEPYYSSPYGMYQIPMIFYHPQNKVKGHFDKIVQQSDIMPSIIDFIGVKAKTTAFGKSVFNPQNTQAHVSYCNGYYQLTTKDYLIKFGENVTEIYDLKTDSLQTNNLLGKIDNDLIEHNEKYLKAFIQQYNNRMIKNQLTVN